MTSMAEGARPWRCFWAVPLPADARALIAAFVAALRPLPGVDEAWRFTDEQTWHLTLAFLGAIEPDAVEPMATRVRDALRDFAPIDASIDRLGAFPGTGRSRVMWLGVTDPSHRLAAMSQAVGAACGLEPDEPFRPHVTLARSRDRHGAALPVPSRSFRSVQLPVSHVVLFRSHLGAGPSRHEELVRITLEVQSPAEVAG